jgi:hypothetical protein
MSRVLTGRHSLSLSGLQEDLAHEYAAHAKPFLGPEATNVLTRCLHCYRPFPTNRTLEHLAIGRRIAFDPEHGRLWAVCPACHRWTLAPIEERWEALEQLERLSTGPARLLVQGENIALLETEDLEIVRIGRADRREEAWWRYGNEFAGRRRRARRVARRGKLFDAVSMLLLVGVPYWGLSDSGEWLNRARRKHFGRHAWHGTSLCPRCGDRLNELLLDERQDLVVEPGGTDLVALWYSCPRCGDEDTDGGHRFTGLTAEHVLRRMLAYENFSGGDEEKVMGAMSLIDGSGSAEEMLRQVAAQRSRLDRFSGTSTLAIEIALATTVEQDLLDMELIQLEARWREEEEIAAIVDRELTLVPPRIER